MFDLVIKLNSGSESVSRFETVSECHRYVQGLPSFVGVNSYLIYEDGLLVYKS